MKFYNQRKLNIQIFADAPEGAGSGGGVTEPTATGTGDTGTTAPTPPSVEVPEYITNYVSGFEDAEQKEYLQGLLSDEKGVNFLKGIVPDPNAEWSINKDDYKDIGFDAEAYIADSREKGISEAVAKSFLDSRKNYLAAQREAMTPELRAMDTVIDNFITSSDDAEKQAVYRELANNAAGRKVLKDIIEKANSATPSAGANRAGGETGLEYTEESFKEAYNIALDNNDQTKINELKAYARRVKDKDDFFYDFIKL